MPEIIPDTIPLRGQDITGRKFSRLTAIKLHHRSRTPKGSSMQFWECQCECGNTAIIYKAFLIKGHTRSCGCLQKEIAIKQFTVHGHSKSTGKSKIYESYQHAKMRCNNPNDKTYSRYGGRGIKFKYKNFTAFLNDIGNTWKPGFTLDRIDNNGHYEPGNCRWATRKQQARNTRKNRTITYKGETKTIAQWIEETGITRMAFTYRLKQRWSLYDVFNKPLQLWRKRLWSKRALRSTA